MKKDFIPVCEPLLGEIEKEHLTDAFDSGWISAGGTYNQKLEVEFSRYCGVKYGSTVANGTAALHTAIRALNLVSGDEVIVPNFNGIYGAFALLYENIVPVPVDAEEGTWNIDPNLIEEKINEKTKAIMIVHLYGHPCDMDPIQEIADKYYLPLIEDAAEAHGAEYKSRKTGSLGDIATFSFYSNKVMTSGEGGIITTNKEEYYKKIEYLKNQCFPLDGPRHFIHEDIGYNYRLTNLQAAIAYAQFTQLEKLVELRISINRKYREMLAEFEGIKFQEEKQGYYSNRWLTTILLNPQKNNGLSKEIIRNTMEKQNIEVRPLWKPMHNQPFYKNAKSYINGVSDKLFEFGLCLPSGSNTTKEQFDLIFKTFNKIFKKFS